MRTLLTIALSTFATMVALATSDADAYTTYRSHSAAGCMVFNATGSSPYPYWSGNMTIGDGTLQNSSSSTMNVQCPIISDSTVSATASGGATLTLYGYSNASGSVLSYACVAYYNGGGNCTVLSSVTAVGTSFSSTVTAPAAWSGRYASDGYYLASFLLKTSPPNGDTAIWSYSLEN